MASRLNFYWIDALHKVNMCVGQAFLTELLKGWLISNLGWFLFLGKVYGSYTLLLGKSKKKTWQGWKQESLLEI